MASTGGREAGTGEGAGPAARDGVGIGGATRGLVHEEPLLFERGSAGRTGVSLPAPRGGVDPADEIPAALLRRGIDGMPEISELEAVRHFTRLSVWNHGIDTGFYPLGSCTMKYNPRSSEALARLPGFANVHPLAPPEMAQGALELMWRLERALSEIAGFDETALSPAAGAHGELCGIMVVRAFHESTGNARRKVLIPDTAHGTNPASSALNGYEVVQLASGEDGRLHPATVKAAMDEDAAAIMITNPNTLGIFESDIREIADAVHAKGGLVYGDGANMNALLGMARPGDMGFDVMQFNLHKTFATPHGGGGPGSGPVAVKARLAPFLPLPAVVKEGERYRLVTDAKERPQSVGRLREF
ncbi:MAG TPA: aminomethyl-transferring glycine dehydrogenase subunit GcvPB, partial [Anaeromyxobacteraceae bacterium]|nr:aminomethyl-transferring glycine dehydrogenase subunit GcvPB [Anaeromyxobacteraceae bacterium]